MSGSGPIRNLRMGPFEEEPKRLSQPSSYVKLRTIAGCATITIPRHILAKLSIQPNDTVHIELVDQHTILVTKEHIKS